MIPTQSTFCFLNFLIHIASLIGKKEQEIIKKKFKQSWDTTPSYVTYFLV